MKHSLFERFYKREFVVYDSNIDNLFVLVVWANIEPGKGITYRFQLDKDQTCLGFL